MSTYGQPISAARFAAALPDLPLSSLHTKAAEIQNSIAHLKQSNSQLKQYADEGDKDCLEAIDENMVVIGRQLERIQLLKAEVQQRGFKWEEAEASSQESDIKLTPYVVPDETVPSEDNQTNEDPQAGHSQGGRIGDDELARRLAERLAEDSDGVHL